MYGEQSPYLQPKQFQLNVGYRGLRSHYPNWQGTKRILVTSGVVNTQQIADITGTYQFNTQGNISVSLPVLFGSFSYLYGPIPNRKDPLTFRERASMQSKGISNISVVARSWILPTDRCRTGNISVGFGLSLPTGNDNATDVYPNITNGLNNSRKAVDISIQPGDGGLGLIGEVSAFKSIKNVTLFGTGVYLSNPRNANTTPSLIVGLLGAAANQRNFMNELTNTVPDLYVGEAGASMAIPQIKGLAVNASARVEGLPPTDLIGGHAGFRRPAVVLFGSPGVTYTRGKNTFSIRVPIRAFTNVLDSPNSPRIEEATVANWIILANYIRRF